MAPSQSATPPAGNGSESTKHNNAVVFSQFNRKLKSSQATEYNEAARRLARWMSDPRAYYEEARPWILTLLRTAQATLREHAGLPEQKDFHVSLVVNNPLTDAYVNLVRTVARYRSYFVKDALQLAGLDGFVQSVEGISIPSNSQTVLNASRSSPPSNVHVKSEPDQTALLDLSSPPVVPHLSQQPSSHGVTSQNPLAPKQHANSVTQSAAPVIPQTIAKYSVDQQITAAYVAKQSATSSNALQVEDSSPAHPSKQPISVWQIQHPQGIPPTHRTGLSQAAPVGALSTPSIPSGPVKLKRRAKRNIPRADILDADDEDAQRILAGAASVVKPPRNEVAPPRLKITSLVESPDSDTKPQTVPEPETGLNHGTGESRESSSHTPTQDGLSIPNALHQQAPAASGPGVKVDEILCPTNTSVEDTPAIHTSIPTPEPREREPQIVAPPRQSSLITSDSAMFQVVPKDDETPPLPNPPAERPHSHPPDLQVPPPIDGASSLIPTSTTITALEQPLLNPPPALDTEANSDPIPDVETTKSPTPLKESTPLSPIHQTTPRTFPDRRRSQSATPIAPGPSAPPSYSSHPLELPKREELRSIPPDTSPPPDISDKRVSPSISSELRASHYPRASSIDSQTQTQGAARPERVPSETSNRFVSGASTPLPISPRHLELLLDTVSEASGARRSISRIADDELGANLSPEDTDIPRSPPLDEPRDHVVPPQPSDTPDDDAHTEDVGAQVPKEPSPSIENEEPNTVVSEESHPEDQATEWPNQSSDHMVATSDRFLPHALESVTEDVSEEAEHDKIVVNTNTATFEPVGPATAHSPPSIANQLADGESRDINHDTNDSMDVARNASVDAAVIEGPSERVATQEGHRNSPATNADNGLASETREISQDDPVLDRAQSTDVEAERPSPSPITNDQPLDTLSPLENNIEHTSMTNGVVLHLEGNDIQAPVSSPPQMNGHIPIVSQPSAMHTHGPLSPVASPAITETSHRSNSAVSPDDGLGRGESDQNLDEPTLPVVTTEVAPFRPGASALVVFQDPTPQSTVCTSFVIDDRLSEMLEQWKNRYRTAGDVRNALSISMVCYASSDIAAIMSAAATNERDAFLEVLNNCPQSWPVDGRLTLGLFFNGTKQRIPMSPPLLPTHDGFVDVSTFIHIGENFVELDGWNSMAGYTFMVLGHLPTPTQLAEVEVRRKANSIWRNDLSSTLHRPLQLLPFVF